MAGCFGCGMPGESNPATCPVCNPPAEPEQVNIWGPGPSEAERLAREAKVVSEALDAVSKRAFHTSIEMARAWHMVATADPAELVYLGRLLKR